MFLIEKNGRSRPICRECRKVHSAAKCPKRKPSMRGLSPGVRAFCERAEAFREWVRTQEAAKHA